MQPVPLRTIPQANRGGAIVTTHILCIGRITGDDRDIVISPQYAPDTSDAWAIGEMDFDDCKPCEPLVYFSDLASIESYILGWRNAQQGAELARRHVPDWQAFIDHSTLMDLDAAASDAEYGSIEDDHDWIRRGC